MTKGGKREGAGRKPSPEPQLQRSIRFSDIEWEYLKVKASESNKNVSEYIRNKVLEG